MWASAPTKRFVGVDGPVRPGPITQHLVGQGPCALPQVREKNPPVTASPCQPPLGKGALRTGDADCHSRCAHRLRNDRLQELRSVVGGGVKFSEFLGCCTGEGNGGGNGEGGEGIGENYKEV